MNWGERERGRKLVQQIFIDRGGKLKTENARFSQDLPLESLAGPKALIARKMRSL